MKTTLVFLLKSFINGHNHHCMGFHDSAEVGGQQCYCGGERCIIKLTIYVESIIHFWGLLMNRIYGKTAITVSTKILWSTTVFNIDDNHKCYLSSKSAYYYDF